MNNLVLVPVSPGDVLDRLSILQIKENHVSSEQQKQIIKKESELFEKAWIERFGDNPKSSEYFTDLLLVNLELWKLEDDVRTCEKSCQFGNDFINSARKIYLTNDKRAGLKSQINKKLNSSIYDVKIFLLNYKELIDETS